MISELLFLVCGLYVGKYYPDYVPLPRIRQEYIDALLVYLKKESTQQQLPAAADEMKHE